ncbi:hypothetical protein HOLleu_21185 [Holothuria leucospilota]|uniref:MADF domain-containing protein n=1 Tax=Holothuria leucospilota TaxID=206669 RepID=A0A9Q1H6M7_HOLLE|nr:hypothetical protein HOLleu_21185 [Holothuria leucospilota]
MASVWPDGQTMKLIEMLQARPILYNTEHPKYHDRDMKRANYQEIAAEVGTEESLRTQYSKVRRPAKSGSGAATTKGRETAKKIRELLSFLEPFMLKRTSISNLLEVR